MILERSTTAFKAMYIKTEIFRLLGKIYGGLEYEIFPFNDPQGYRLKVGVAGGLLLSDPVHEEAEARILVVTIPLHDESEVFV